MQKKIFDLYQQRAATAHLTVYIAIRYEDVMYVGMYFTSMYARMSDKLCSGIHRRDARWSIAQGLRIFPLFPSTARPPYAADGRVAPINLSMVVREPQGLGISLNNGRNSRAIHFLAMTDDVH